MSYCHKAVHIGDKPIFRAHIYYTLLKCDYIREAIFWTTIISKVLVVLSNRFALFLF
jgi:hypothetical protein